VREYVPTSLKSVDFTSAQMSICCFDVVAQDVSISAFVLIRFGFDQVAWVDRVFVSYSVVKL
jgi:hypothetical protein